MKPDPAQVLLVRQAENSGGMSLFDRDRLPAAAAVIILGVAALVATVVGMSSGMIAYLVVIFCLWTVGGTMIWGGLFMPFHIGWVGVLIGLLSQPFLALIIVQGLMSGC